MDNNDLLNDLQNYMTTNTFIQKYNKPIYFKHTSGLNKIKLFNDEYTKEFNKEQNKKTISHKSKNSDNTILDLSKSKESKYVNNKRDFSPEEKDKLFWCFYIFINGYEKYELEKTSSFKIEKEFKFMIAEKLNSLKSELKLLGLKKNDIREELTNQSCITVKSILLLCHIYKINLLYVKNNYYYLFEPNKNIINNDNNNDEIEYPLKCILHENDKIYIKDINDNEEQNKLLLYYKDNYWQIENINKPIKSFSSYSLLELQDICKKLKLPIEINNKKMLKKDLYESIIKVF